MARLARGSGGLAQRLVELLFGLEVGRVARAVAARRAVGQTGRVSRRSGTRWYGHATRLVVAGMFLAGTAAGCSSPSPVTAGSVTSCYQFAARAIQRHVTVAAVPAACQGLSQVSLGMTLVFLGPASTATALRSADGPAPAGHPSVFVIAAHITAACITILLATLAAIGAG
jgi:hypothetical protein